MAAAEARRDEDDPGMAGEERSTMATFMRVISAAAMVLMTSAAAGAQGAARNEADLIRSRQAISTMEAVLQRAVSNGAEMVMAQIRNVMPTDRPRLSMSPRVSTDPVGL